MIIPAVDVVTWPLWWHLEPAAQALLMQFQFGTYGFRLQIPPEPGHGHIKTEVESPEEIDRIMRQAPKHQKRMEAINKETGAINLAEQKAKAYGIPQTIRFTYKGKK